MIHFNYEIDFNINNEASYREWIIMVGKSEGRTVGEVSYIFCSDEYLLELNQKYLSHDTFTDIISFDYSVGNELQGDVFISVDRVRENAVAYNINFDDELRRVMIHGILHFIGFKDKSVTERDIMRYKEDEKLKLFHVEQ